LETLLIPNNSTLNVVTLVPVFFKRYLPPLNIDFQGCHSNPKVSQKLSFSNAQFPFNFEVVSVHTKSILTTVAINHKSQTNNIPNNQYGHVVSNYYKYNISKYKLHPTMKSSETWV
jgi:hypothetical protein